MGITEMSVSEETLRSEGTGKPPGPGSDSGAKGEVQGPLTDNDLIMEKIENMTKFLEAIPAVKENPQFVIHLSLFADKEDVKVFKAWFRDNISPKMGEVDKVLEGMLTDYNLLKKDFTEDQLDRLKRYLKCFEYLINPPAEEPLQKKQKRS